MDKIRTELTELKEMVMVLMKQTVEVASPPPPPMPLQVNIMVDMEFLVHDFYSQPRH